MMFSSQLKKLPWLAIGFIISFIAYANPEGGVVVGGDATLEYDTNQLDIYQNSSSAIIDWDSFDIGVDESTVIHQLSSDAILLNRITSSDPSQILGSLTANGNVVLINSNGILFGSDSVIDVNSLIATTSDISNEDFMSGGLNFTEPGSASSFIINQGQITAKEAGLVALVAPNVVNNGVISAKLGRVELASGTSFSVDLYGDGLYELNISDDVASQFISNTGSLSAEGGVIAITAAAGQEIVNSLITIEGELNAPTIEEKSGKIIISAAGSNSVDGNVEEDKGQIEGYSTVVIDNAYLNASGRDEGEQGGEISITGDVTYILDDAVIDASGDSSIALSDGSDGTATMTADKTVVDEATFLESEYRAGGSIKIGGDYLGGGDTATSLYVYVDEDAYILNDAISSGDGGRTIIWSDDTTEFYGNMFASGGSEGGNGGFLETSGKEYLSALGYADLTAIEGYNKGTYLLDPANITIYGNSTFSPDEIANGVMWLDASQIDTTIYSDGDEISTWEDSFGLGNDVSQYGTNSVPVYVEDAGNGMASVLFTQDFLQTTNSFTFDDLTVFVVFNDSDGTSSGNHERLVDHDYQNGFWVGRDGSAADTFGGGVKQGRPPYGDYVTATDGEWNILGNQRSGTVHTAWSNGDFDNGASSTVVNTTTASNPIAIGGWINNGNTPAQATDMYISEVIIYSDDITADERSLLEQYQATKWDIEIDSSSHSAFTTDYLEHLSATADIILQADDTITLDLQGDTLTLDADRSITLKTVTGDITDVSAGTITTTQTTTGGNITIDAGGAISLDSTSLNALSGGVVNLSAGNNSVSGTINVSQTSDLNLGTLNSSTNQAITLSSANDINFNTAQALQETLTATAGGDMTLSAAISATKDITLEADTITLDLQSNTISVDNTNNASIKLTATAGNITDDSNGTIETDGGNITLDASGAISLGTTNLSASNSGVVNLSAGDAIDVSQTSTLNLGSLSSSNNQAITLSSANDINFNTELTLQEMLTASASGNIILNADVSTSNASANAIQLSANGNFINNAGSDALSASNSSWIVHSNAFSNNTRDGLLPDESLFGQANITTAMAAATANNDVFSYNSSTRPTLTYTVQDNSVEVGNALTGTTISYTSGLEMGDLETSIGQTGVFSLNTNYTTSTGVGTYTNDLGATIGTLTNLLGYQYTFIDGDLTVTETASENALPNTFLESSQSLEINSEAGQSKNISQVEVTDSLSVVKDNTILSEIASNDEGNISINAAVSETINNSLDVNNLSDADLTQLTSTVTQIKNTAEQLVDSATPQGDKDIIAQNEFDLIQNELDLIMQESQSVEQNLTEIKFASFFPISTNQQEFLPQSATTTEQGASPNNTNLAAITTNELKNIANRNDSLFSIFGYQGMFFAAIFMSIFMPVASFFLILFKKTPQKN